MLPEDTDEDALIAKTQRGEYAMKSDSWMSLSLEAMDFTQATLLHKVFGTDVPWCVDIYIIIYSYIYIIHIIDYIYTHINKLWNSRRFSRQSEQWNLKSCPKALLRVDPEKRMTAAEALQHPWLKANLGQLDWTNFALYSKWSDLNFCTFLYRYNTLAHGSENSAPFTH